MTYEELYKKILNKDYESKLPYPTYRHDVQERKANAMSDLAMKRAFQEDEQHLQNLFRTDVREYVETTLGKPLTDAQFGAIYYFAYKEGHGSGYQDVVSIMQDLMDIVKLF